MKKEEDPEKQEEEGKFQRQREEELEIQRKKVEIQKKSCDIRRETVREERYKNVKLPNLIITKFEGTHIGWFPFWNQYETEIDRSELHLVSRFNYLKKLLAPKVRLLIDTSPFQKQPFSGILRKRCSENMQQSCIETSLKSHFSMGVLL